MPSILSGWFIDQSRDDNSAQNLCDHVVFRRWFLVFYLLNRKKVELLVWQVRLPLSSLRIWVEQGWDGHWFCHFLRTLISSFTKYGQPEYCNKLAGKFFVEGKTPCLQLRHQNILRAATLTTNQVPKGQMLLK